jgi:electron transfer flavoprotein beta subunit
MGAKSKPQETLSLTELGVEPDRAGEQGSRTEVYSLNEPPARGESRKIEGDGNAAQAVLDFLAEKRLI